MVSILTVLALLCGASLALAAEWPLTEEKVNFSVFTQISGQTVEDIETNAFTKWYEDQTNVHIDWSIVASGAGQQIPLIIASGELPDMFFGNMTDVQIMTYALLDQIFVPLTDYVNEYGDNIKKMLAESEIARQYTYMPDGNIYTLLRVVDTYNEKITKRAWVYQPWLDALSMDLPQTTDEFYEMLVRFQNEIPTLLGVTDIVPFAGALQSNPTNNEPESYIMNAFCYYDVETFLEVGEDGKLSFVANTEAYRDGVRFLNKLYKEGLLAADTWTMDRKGLLNLTEGSDVNKLGVASAMYWGHFTTENGPLGRDKEFVALPALEGPSGVRNAYDRGMLVNNGKLVATTECDNLDIVIKWADWFFDADAMMESGYSANYGPVGVGWDYAAPGELNAAGEQAKYKYLRAVDTKQNDNWFQTEPYYESRAFLNSIVNDAMNRKEAFGGQQTAEKYMPYSAFDKKVPFMYFPLEYTEELTKLKDDLRNTTTGEVNVYRNRFITGELNIDSDKDWAEYCAVLMRVGVDRYVELYQILYDNYLEMQATIGF